MRSMYKLLLAALVASSFILAGCAGPASQTSQTETSASHSQTGTTSQSQAASPYAAPSKNTPVVGSGATFPKPLLEQWGSEFAKKSKTVQVSYAGGGSGKGISDITKKDVLFAGSDAPLSASEQAKANADGNTILQFPETLGLVALTYNLDGVSNHLKLDGPTVGKMFAGQITRWNDAAIKATNPNVNLPDQAISVAVRSDSSGTTFVFTDWLSTVSPDFSSTIAAGATKAPDWTKSSAQVQKGNGNDGVANAVATTKGAIGYVELAYAQGFGLKTVDIKNKDGNFVAPSTQGAADAAASVANNLPRPDGDWSKITIVNAPGATSYPISTFTYMLVYDDLAAYGGKFSADQMQAFKAWMYWCLHEGQASSETLVYAPLPAAVVQIGVDALASI